jgi:sugar phosphate isomerase/epimerase
MDFSEFFSVPDKNNYAGWMVVEEDVKYGATVVPPVESVAASLRYFKEIAAPCSEPKGL